MEPQPKSSGDGAKPPGGGGRVATGGGAGGEGKFFRHGRTLWETGNFDYAVECFLHGLKLEPTNVLQHQVLLEIAKSRRLAGGRAAGEWEKMRHTGKDAVEKMTLVAERFWAMKPEDADLLMDFVGATAEAHAPERGLDMREVMGWVAGLLLEGHGFERPVTVGQISIAVDLLCRVEAFEPALVMCRAAVGMDPGNLVLGEKVREIQGKISRGEMDAV